VKTLKRLAIAAAGAHQLDDSAGTHPALTDGVRGIACPETATHMSAISGREMADLDWQVSVATKLGDNHLMLPALVVFDRQEQVGALLGGELKNAGEICSASAWISTHSSSSILSTAFRAARLWETPVSNEVCAIATPSSRA
jgi:hypothetical protein